MNSPEFLARLDAIEAANERRARAIANAGLTDAGFVLRELAVRFITGDAHPEPARKAANALARLAKPPKEAPAPARAPEPDAQARAPSPPNPPPPANPHPHPHPHPQPIPRRPLHRRDRAPRFPAPKSLRRSRPSLAPRRNLPLPIARPPASPPIAARAAGPPYPSA